MKKEEAIKIIKENYPDRAIDKVTETDKYFLISISNEGDFVSDIIKPMICDDGLKAVDKKTKQVFTYNPISHR